MKRRNNRSIEITEFQITKQAGVVHVAGEEATVEVKLDRERELRNNEHNKLGSRGNRADRKNKGGTPKKKTNISQTGCQTRNRSKTHGVACEKC